MAQRAPLCAHCGARLDERPGAEIAVTFGKLAGRPSIAWHGGESRWKESCFAQDPIARVLTGSKRPLADEADEASRRELAARYRREALAEIESRGPGRIVRERR